MAESHVKRLTDIDESSAISIFGMFLALIAALKVRDNFLYQRLSWTCQDAGIFLFVGSFQANLVPKVRCRSRLWPCLLFRDDKDTRRVVSLPVLPPSLLRRPQLRCSDYPAPVWMLVWRVFSALFVSASIPSKVLR